MGVVLDHLKIKVLTYGEEGLRWKNIYCETSEISTSDKNLKSDIQNIDKNLLKKWKNVEWKSFKLKDGKRTHTGVIAQDLIAAIKDIDLTQYAFLCFDKWDDQYKIIERRYCRAGSKNFN